MAEEAPLKPVREVLLKIRNAADAALKRIDQPPRGFSVQWVCTSCRYVKTFVKPVDLDVVGKCPRCRSSEFRIAGQGRG
jgi:Zn finger protein HypA/HybF involved in hydrogenase expression